ncbi:unnamed protein product [Didymodactylos carnosus]|uniref:Uncharacterized protein n=1 Tax=Didymodactylos carnosus TaxID=1234261 RepID=A0A814A3U9_9BILA|nr:unnamed protein product [Didymodactylos carnosus]CAF3689940.1 unnamed protein product [Didymodactylos carnosus]
MVYDRKCTIVSGMYFLQATILEIQFSHEPEYCLVKLDYNHTELYVESSAIFQMPFEGLEDDDMDNDKLVRLKCIQSLINNPSSIRADDKLITQLDRSDGRYSYTQSETGSDEQFPEHYIDPFDRRYNSSDDDDEEEYSATHSQPTTPGITLATVR